MSTHYLISAFNDEINDVVVATGTPPQTTATGNYVVRVSDDVSVQNPTNLSDLLTKKYAGILGTFGLFTQITYDDMFDASGVDFGNSSGITAGKKGTVGLYASHLVSSVLQTTPQAITWGGVGDGPPQAVLTYELFEYIDEDDKDAAFTRSYRELAPDLDVSVALSFDGGLSFVSTQDKALVSIPLASQGDQLVVRITRLSDVNTRGRVLVGSWAVLY